MEDIRAQTRICPYFTRLEVYWDGFARGLTLGRCYRLTPRVLSSRLCLVERVPHIVNLLEELHRQ